MSTAVSNYPPIHHYIIQKASVSQLIKKVYETQLKSYLRYAIFQWCNYIISQHITVDIILFLQHSHLKNIWFLSYCWSSNHHNWSTNRHMRTPTNVFGTSTGTNWLFYRHIIGCPTFVTGIASPLWSCICFNVITQHLLTQTEMNHGNFTKDNSHSFISCLFP